MDNTTRSVPPTPARARGGPRWRGRLVAPAPARARGGQRVRDAAEEERAEEQA
jgi:hypothetical protein